MGDAGDPGSARKCPGVALADLGNTEGLEKGGEEGQLYASELSDGVYKRKKVTAQEGGGAEARRVERCFICRPQTAPPAGVYWEQVRRLRGPRSRKGLDDRHRISSPYVATGQHHKVRKVTNSGTRLCSYVPETKNVVVSGQYTLKTSNSREGILKMVSEFSPAGIIGTGKEPTSTILLEVILRDPPDDFVEVLLQAQVDQRARAKRTWGLHQSSGATCGALYLEVGGGGRGIQHEAEHRFLDISKIHVGPIELKRLRFTPADLTPDQSSVVLGASELVRQ